MRTSLLLLAALMAATDVQAQDTTTVVGKDLVFVYADIVWSRHTVTVEEAWSQVDAIVHLRITRTFPPAPQRQPDGRFLLCTEHEAVVLDLLKPHKVGGPVGEQFRFLQESAGVWTTQDGYTLRGEAPYAEGMELVAFLGWRPALARFAIPPWSGPMTVRNGRVFRYGRPDDDLFVNVPVGIPVSDLLAKLRAAKKQQAPGSISGCITDVSGGQLPGVTVAISGPESQRQIVTQSNGCYGTSDLAPGRYSVRATLAGFCPAEHDNLVVTPGGSVEANLTLMVGALSMPLWVEMGARYDWTHADAVVYLRVDERVQTSQWPAPTCGSIACTEYVATVVSVGKQHDSGPKGDMFIFLQDYVDSGEPPNPGDEFVAFLRWNAAWRTFVRFGGPSSLLAVRAGRVVTRSPQDGDLNGITVEDFLAKLRALAKESR